MAGAITLRGVGGAGALRYEEVDVLTDAGRVARGGTGGGEGLTASLGTAGLGEGFVVEAKELWRDEEKGGLDVLEGRSGAILRLTCERQPCSVRCSSSLGTSFRCSIRDGGPEDDRFRTTPGRAGPPPAS